MKNKEQSQLNVYISTSVKENQEQGFRLIPTKAILGLSNAQLTYYLSLQLLHKKNNGQGYRISSSSVQRHCGIGRPNQNLHKKSLEGAYLNFDKAQGDTLIEYTFPKLDEGSYIMLRSDQLNSFSKDRKEYMLRLKALAITYKLGQFPKANALLKFNMSRGLVYDLIRTYKKFDSDIELYESLSDGQQVIQVEPIEVQQHKQEAKVDSTKIDVLKQQSHEALQYLNETFGTKVSHKTWGDKIITRLKSSSLMEFKLVVMNRYLEWKDDSFMRKHMNISVILRKGNYDKYLDHENQYRTARAYFINAREQSQEVTNQSINVYKRYDDSYYANPIPSIKVVDKIELSNNNQDKVQQVLHLMSSTYGRTFDSKSDITITSNILEHYTMDDVKRVIFYLNTKWDNDTMRSNLRPSTIFKNDIFNRHLTDARSSDMGKNEYSNNVAELVHGEEIDCAKANKLDDDAVYGIYKFEANANGERSNYKEALTQYGKDIKIMAKSQVSRAKNGGKVSHYHYYRVQGEKLPNQLKDKYENIEVPMKNDPIIYEAKDKTITIVRDDNEVIQLNPIKIAESSQVKLINNKVMKEQVGGIKDGDEITFEYLKSLGDNDELNVSYHKLDENMNIIGNRKFTEVDVASIIDDMIGMERTYYHIVA